MAKRLMILTAMLAAMLALAVPALAQETQEEAITGVVEAIDTNPEGTSPYGLYVEEFGTGFFLRGGEDFAAYEGQEVTVYGTREPLPGATAIIDVSRVEPVANGAGEDQYTVEERDINFELTVEGEPPADAAFSGSGPLVGLPAPLADPDGDGVYTGSATVEVTVNPDGTTQPVPVAIYGGVGTGPSGDPAEPFAGATDGLVLVDFSPVVLEDGQMLSGSYSFDEGEDAGGQGGTTMGGETTAAVETEDGGTPEQAGIDLNEDGAVDEADGDFAVQTSDEGVTSTPDEGALPGTGGLLLPIAGLVGLVAVAGGVLHRRRLAS